MSGRDETRLAAFRSRYAAALGEYLRDPSEGSLTIAYELGRAAVKDQLTVLELTVAYQEALANVLSVTARPAEVRTITRFAGEFLLESMSSFEMLHRGAAEARGSVQEYRRRVQLSRQLSTFLADSSLALQSSVSLGEVLHLAVDQGREILDADCCLATVAEHGSPRAVEAVSHPEPSADWQFTRWLDLSEIYRLLEQGEGVLALAGDEAAQLAMSGAMRIRRPIRGWLAVSLTALDGTQIGALQAFDTQTEEFSDEDQAALVHLAQMVSGTVERVRLYQQDPPW
ncbi:MAG: GAF domain-containing protein [Solirubrobacterales bacterium]|nr:GAF domain-containing protein [Solirubrobacterales bacterium]